MKSPLIRKILIAAGVLVLLLAAALAYIATTFDPNAYKGVVIDYMKTKYDRTLAIEGPITLSVFPRLAVQASGVSLSEKSATDTFVALEEASLSVALLPLLRQELIVDRIRARGLRLNYHRTSDGKTNLDDLMAGDPAQQPEPAAKAELRFDVSGIDLSDLRVRVSDDQAKFAGEVILESLTTGRVADGVESRVSLKAQLALTAPAAQGELSGNLLLTPNLAARSAQLRDIDLQWKGDLPGATAVDAAVTGALAYDGAAGTVVAEDLQLSAEAQLGALQLSRSTLEVARFGFDPTQQALSLSKLRVQVAGTSGGHPLSLALDWPELAVTGQALNGSPLSGRFVQQGPNAVDATFQSGAPSGTFERIVLPRLQATLKGRSGPRALEGTLSTDLLLHTEPAAVALEALDTHIQLTEPSLQPMDIRLQGQADANAQAAHWALKGQINANPFTSEGNARLDTTPLTLNANARFDSLDLNRLLPPESASESKPAPGGGAGPADTPVDLSALNSLQGKFQLRAAALAYQTYRIADAVLDAQIQNGVLRVSQLSGKTWGGSVQATAQADARNHRVAVNATANGVNVDALLKDVAKKDILEGTGRVTADLTSSGRTVNELKRQLDGKAGLQLRDGAVKGVNLAKSLRQARATLGLKPADERQRARQEEKTDFSELTATFAIADGVARSNDLDAKSPFLRLGGDGALDIGQGLIDYTARATVTASSKGQGGEELAALSGLTIPVHLSGPFEAIDWNIRWSAVATQALKTEIGGQIENKLKDQVRDRLGLPSPAASAASSSATGGESLKDAARDKLKDRLKGLIK